MNVYAKVGLTAWLLVSATPALAHRFACEQTMGVVQVDESGAPVLGEDGLPVFVSSPAWWLFEYPVTIGFRVTVRNTAAATSVVTGWWSSIVGRADVTWYGASLAPGSAFPAGSSDELVAVVRLEDQAACMALGGFGPVPELPRGTPACGTQDLQHRFVVSHEAGSAECRAAVGCGNDATPPVIPGPSGPSDWSVVHTTSGLAGVWASAADDVWAVGLDGFIVHWDGQSWSTLESGVGDYLQDVWGFSADDVWAVGGSVALHWDGATWSVRLTTAENLTSVWGAGPDDVWATSERTMFHWDGATWTEFPVVFVPPNIPGLSGLWGTSSTDVWAGGTGLLLHWDGSSWNTVLLSHTRSVYDLWGLSTGEFFAAGDYFIYRIEPGFQESVQTFPYSSYDGVWGSSASDVWAVGSSGVEARIAHFDGVTWTEVPAPDVPWLRDVWGTGPDDVWAVSSGGQILRYTGP